MNVSIEEFLHELALDVRNRVDQSGQYSEEAFFEVVTDRIMAAGDLNEANRAYFYNGRGVRVDGYGGHPADEDGNLSLIVCDYNPDLKVQSLTRTDMDADFRRAESFLAQAFNASFRDSLEETTPAFGLATMIADFWKAVSKVRLILVSNKVLSSRVDSIAGNEFEGIPVAYSVWDLSRLHRYAQSGSEREPIRVDFLSEFGHGLPVLPAHLEGVDYEAYLATVPGVELASIYDRWGARLLEQNVRVFLQARGNVNRGIRSTIENAPEMFFAYNNGITATAEGVETRRTSDGLELTAIDDLQIVNGGQTTASIHANSRRKDVDLSKVFVQMKLSIVAPERSIEIVPKISEYANSQNRVNAADFFANHPFHVRIEGFSRRIFAPAADGTVNESKWFYERARGQYQDARGNLTQAERRRFDLEFPKRHSFTKTDLAKYINVWEQKPDTVSKGAQKNFADFAGNVGKAWERNANQFNEMYYRELIAKAVVFKSVEKIVSDAPWYEGGYRANIVAYAISKLSHDLAEMNESVDFERVWRRQDLTPGLRDALAMSSEVVNQVITTPPVGSRNVTEWAKQQACWNRVKELAIEWPESLRQDLMSRAERRDQERSSVRQQKVLNGIELQMAVVQAGAQFWSQVREWGAHAGRLSERDRGVLEVAMSIPSSLPSEAQCRVLLETLEKLQEEGCPLELELTQ